MLYHASTTPNLSVLEPRVSNHEKPLIYFSQRRENVLVYLSNAVELHAKRAGIVCQNPIKKWASYGFTKEGVLQLDEYYPNATQDTYQGVSGYIYSVERVEEAMPLPEIPFVFVSKHAVKVTACEAIPDAYEAIVEAAEREQIVLCRYEENSRGKLDWIQNAIRREYADAQEHPEYRAFLKAKFDFLSF